MYFIRLTILCLYFKSDVVDLQTTTTSLPINATISALHSSKRGIIRAQGDASVRGPPQFQNPDVTARYKINGKEVKLHAYKDPSNPNGWISIGHPGFLKNGKGSHYTLAPESIRAQLQLLPDDQKSALESAIKTKYPNIDRPSINLIALQGLSCTTKFVDKDQDFVVQGSVQGFDTYQVTLEMPYRENSQIREAFLSRVAKKDDLQWTCTFIAYGQPQFSNELKISEDILEDIASEIDLFGTYLEVYVTAEQLHHFARQIRIKLNKEAAYSLDERYDRKIFQQWFKKVRFENVEINEALFQLSNTLNVNSLSPDEIKTELSDMFVVGMVNTRPVITIAYGVLTRTLKRQQMLDDGNQTVDSMTNSSKRNMTRSSAKKRSSLNFKHDGVNLQPSINTVQAKTKVWWGSQASLQAQVDDINKAIDQSIQWSLNTEQTQLSPTSYKVALISRNVFGGGLSISFRRKHVKDPAYKKNFVIATATSSQESGPTNSIENLIEKAEEGIKEIWKKINAMQPSQPDSSQMMNNIVKAMDANEENLRELWQKVNDVQQAVDPSGLYGEIDKTGNDVEDDVMKFGDNLKKQRASQNQTTVQQRHVKSTIESYKMVCKDVDSSQDTVFPSLTDQAITNYPVAFNEAGANGELSHLDGFACSPFGIDFFVQDVGLNCKKLSKIDDRGTRLQFLKHCYRCCRYEFSYKTT